MRIWVLCIGASWSALAVSAHAQEIPAPTTADAVEAPADGEIVVTAQRREQRLSEVPMSVSAFTAETLQSSGVVNSLDLQAVTPGLQFPVNGAFAQPTIRGIGTTVTSAGSDANVAIYIDGVYMPNQSANIFELNDVQRIEVLKGPQGTLYGRNATGGAINITTLTPSFDPVARARLSYGSFDEVRANVYVSAPIGDRVAFGVSGLYTDDNGYSRDVVRDVRLAAADERAVRGRLLIQATDDFDITIAGDWSRRYDERAYALKPFRGNTAQAAAIIPDDPFEAALTFTPYFRAESYGGSVTGALRLGDYTLTSITALRQVDDDFVTDLDRTQVAASAATFNTAQRTFTQELNLASGGGGPLTWVAGVFYYNDKAQNLNLLIGGVPGIYGRVDSEAIAGFAEGTWEIAPRLSLVGGLRYSTEERSFLARRTNGDTIDTNVRYNSWTPRASIRYEIANGQNVYATYTSGFKSGTYNISAFSPTPVRPESVDAFEIGFRSYRRGVTFNAAAFYYSYDDIQVQALQPSTGLTALTNAARAEIYGIEMEGQVPLDRAFTLRGGFGYTHAKYTDFPGALLTFPRTSGCGANPNRPCGNTQSPADASGNDMVRTPRWTANLSLDYAGNVGNGELRGSVTGSYNSGFYWDAGNRLEQPDYILVNASLSWGPDDSFWRVGLWGRNLLDETYQLYLADTTQGDSVAYARPRSIGVSLELDF